MNNMSNQAQGGTGGAYFTSQPTGEAVNQNTGISGQTAAQSVFGVLPEQVIATDALISAKHAVTAYAKAITEASNPQLKETFKRHLDQVIAAQESIGQFMGSKGWYDAWNPQHQIQIDMQCADDALKLQI